MEVHPYATAAECDAFQPKAQPLFLTLRSVQRDPAAGGHNSVPGEAVRSLDGPDCYPRSYREAGGIRCPPIRDHLAPRDPRDDRSNST
jgi:hypothetical protein